METTRHRYECINVNLQYRTNHQLVSSGDFCSTVSWSWTRSSCCTQTSRDAVILVTVLGAPPCASGHGAESKARPVLLFCCCTFGSAGSVAAHIQSWLINHAVYTPEIRQHVLYSHCKVTFITEGHCSNKKNIGTLKGR